MPSLTKRKLNENLIEILMLLHFKSKLSYKVSQLNNLNLSASSPDTNHSFEIFLDELPSLWLGKKGKNTYKNLYTKIATELSGNLLTVQS